MDAPDAICLRLTELLDSQEDAGTLEDKQLSHELEAARCGQLLLSNLTPAPTPVGFSRRIQTRVRRRSGGRYFNPAQRPFGYSVSVEAFVVVAVAIMAASWMVLGQKVDVSDQVLYPDPPEMSVPAGK